ncbi:MAG TPA: hypothetical protein VMI76_04355 [Methyloceanibacter sp.]|nr:hypothetical protein [Methyloceanibacter sp.]
MYPPYGPKPFRLTPPFIVDQHEVGIYNPSQFTLSFLLGDPPTEVKLDPRQIKIIPATAGSVRAQIKTGFSDFSAYGLSAGSVYAIVFSSGTWMFAKY